MNRVLVFWSWNGKVDEQGIIRSLDQFKSQGIEGFFIHARAGLEVEYMSDRWIELTRFTAKEGYILKFYTKETVPVEGEIQFVELTEFPKIYHREINGEDFEHKSTGNEYIYIEIIANN